MAANKAKMMTEKYVKSYIEKIAFKVKEEEKVRISQEEMKARVQSSQKVKPPEVTTAKNQSNQGVNDRRVVGAQNNNPQTS